MGLPERLGKSATDNHRVRASMESTARKGWRKVVTKPKLPTIEVFPHEEGRKIRWGWRIVTARGNPVTHWQTRTIDGRIYREREVTPGRCGYRSKEDAVAAGRRYSVEQDLPVSADFIHAFDMGPAIHYEVW